MRYLAGALVGAAIVLVGLCLEDIVTVYFIKTYDSFMPWSTYFWCTTAGALICMVGVQIGKRTKRT